MTDAAPRRRPIDLDRLRTDVVGTAPWTAVEGAPVTDSTNADAVARWRDGAEAGLVLTTDEQRSGRGRLGRSFTTPPGSAVLVSVLLQPQVPAASWGWLSLIAGLAVADTARSARVDAEVGVKWPNDVLLDDRKVCGILLERAEGPGGAAAVIGIGLNVDLTTGELPVPSAVSLSLAGAEVLERQELAVTLLRHLGRRYQDWIATGGDATGGLLEEYRRASATIGRQVSIELPDGAVREGRADDVDADGRLLVDGVAYSAGDVTHARLR